MKINIHQVDAFTDKIFGGNPAGVVTNAGELTEDQMQKIAREMNLSETAFVLSPSSDNADLKLRFFTPSSEVKFCGHATVGALFQLVQLNKFELGSFDDADVKVETNVGILSMTIINQGYPKVQFTAPDLELESYRLQGADFAKEFGVSTELIDFGSVIYHDKNLNYVYIPVRSLDKLGKQIFDFTNIRKQFGSEGVIVFCFYSNQTLSKQADLHARGLAPNVGVNEDPFTGSMQAGLVISAKKNNLISENQQNVKTEQGYFIGRSGSAEVLCNPAKTEISVVASAVSVFSAEMEL